MWRPAGITYKENTADRGAALVRCDIGFGALYGSAGLTCKQGNNNNACVGSYAISLKRPSTYLLFSGLEFEVRERNSRIDGRRREI